MSHINTYKRIMTVLLLCLNLAAADAQFKKAAEPELRHGGVATESNPLTDNHPTLDQVKQKADLAAAMQPQLEKPDFAFPETVEADAQKIYREALKKRQPVTALRAAMALTVSDNLVTHDSLSRSLERYRHLSKTLQPPYSAIAELLEAKLLRDVYAANSWQMDERTLPIDNLDPNPVLWSGDQIRNQLSELCLKILRQRDILSVTPVSSIAPLITNPEEYVEMGLSLFDFTIYRLLSWSQLISPKQSVAPGPEGIPFIIKGGSLKDSISTTTPGTMDSTSMVARAKFPDAIELTDMLIEADSISDDPSSSRLFMARIARLNLLDKKGLEAFGAKLLELYPADSSWRQQVVAALVKRGYFNPVTPGQKHEFMEFLRSTAALNPDTPEASFLLDRAASIAEPWFNIISPGQILPGKPAKMDYEISNVPEIYFLLVSLGANPPSERMSQRDIPSKARIKEALKISTDLTLPWEKEGQLDIPPLDYGYYAVVPSSTPDLSGRFRQFDDYDISIINVSDITLIVASGSTGNPVSQCKVYVTEATTGAPISGAEVTCRGYKERGYNSGSRKLYTEKYVTDANGAFICGMTDYTCTVRRPDGSIIRMSLNDWSTSPQIPSDKKATLLTDLALYHPGDELNAVALLAQSIDNIPSPMAGQEVSIQLFDANRQPVQTVKAVTDSLGRAEASFRIPEDRMTGTYWVSAHIGEPRSPYNGLGFTTVQVAEYKAPTFKVTIDKPLLKDETLEITGSVITYSGMPLSDCETELNINFRRIWWWRPISDRSLPSTFTTKLTTDAQGRFSLLIGLENLMDTPYEYGYFTIDATATSEAGETQGASSKSFAIGRGFHTELDDLTLEAEDEFLRIPVKVTDLLGDPVQKELFYDVTSEDGEVIDSGNFISPSLKLRSTDIPSGRYNVRVILPDAYKAIDGPDKGKLLPDTTSVSMVVWRKKDTRPPYPTPLWIPESYMFATEEASSMDVTVGSAYWGSMLFYQISDCKNVISNGFIKASDANVKIKVPVPKEGNRVFLNVRGIHDLETSTGMITIRPAIENQKLNLTTETFRDKIYPASNERWSFKFTCDGMPVGGGAALAVMSDAALNAITPFRWSYNNRSLMTFHMQGGVHTPMFGNGYFGGNLPNTNRSDAKTSSTGIGFMFTTPNWNLWGKDFYGLFSSEFEPVIAYGSANGVEKFTAVKQRAVYNEAMDMAEESIARGVMMSKATASSYTDSVTMEEADLESDDIQEEGSQLDDLTLRETEHPLAFFKPLLTTDAEGIVTLDFEVPDFNTTWALQLLAYDDRMRSAYLAEEVVAAKPAMISTNMPRFLLTGDKATVSATMFNNSDELLTLNGRIEIIDPTSGKLIAFSDSGNIPTDPSANATFTASFTVPSDCNALIIRSAVRSPRGSDGEQDLVQVLPSSQPVIESTTFYLTQEQKEMEVSIPEMGADDLVTLNYCANPAWFVLTSLSGFIKPESKSTLTNLNALFANCVAGGLIGKYPSLRDGLTELFKENQPDSLLLSPLEQKGELKVSTLLNTPWVNNARSETARMAGLESLLDAGTGKDVVASIIDDLQTCRMSDGSFKWFPQMKEGSLWITLNVLDCAAAMKENGYSPKSVKFDGMVRDAIRYADIELGKSFREIVKKHKESFSLTTEIDYFLNRSLLTSTPVDGQLSDMHKDMMRRLPKEWRKLGIGYKAKAARLLRREGQEKLAHEIMQSVLQFASYKPDKGMWFDRLPDDWFSPSPKMVTATVMLALREIMPGDEAIMRMAQYLVLSRQTEDWNLDMSPAAVTVTANAVLGTDLGWTDSAASESPVITLGGAPLELPSGQSLTGNIWLSLTPEQASGKMLAVRRSASTPAWGGVMRQFVSPVKDVRMASVPQLKVTKRLLPIETTSSGQVASKESTLFSKGDLVRVTLTLEADRDLDYVIVNDRRGAFMQPTEQLTDYTLQNGLWILRETRNTATNFYLTKLPKGSYIISYDVYADRDGEYSTGIATAQSQYYPMITAHSAGCLVTVE